MKLNRILKITGSVFIITAALIFTSCTSEFDKWNTDKNSASPEDMTHDNMNTGAFFSQMEHNVFIVGLDKGGAFQIEDMLTGGLFSGYFSNIKASYDVGSVHNAHYSFPDKWVNQPFNDTYTNVMQPWLSLKTNSDANGTAAVTALANVLKVFGMSRITDMYGPIPYTKFGTAINVAYDSQEDVYKAFFTELNEAIETLTSYYDSDNSAKLLADFDYVFSGNVEKWIKFANTLRLRLALRIAYANETLAKEEAQLSFNSSIGFLESAAIHANNTSYSFLNPFWEVTQSWGDMRMCASIESYLSGYKDPRESAYFAEAANGGGIHGVYPGLQINNQNYYTDYTSAMKVSSGDAMQWMSGAESYFLRAEAKLRWDMGDVAVKDLYEDGIRASFTEEGVSGADAYIANSTDVPADFEDNSNSSSWNKKNADAVGSITIAWDDDAAFEQKLERIITQKWLAIFPDEQEAWSEYRRTGYPHLFTVDYNASNGTVDTDLQVRRLRFPTSEYSTNAANVQAAVGLLGGADNGGTKLWWDKNPRH